MVISGTKKRSTSRGDPAVREAALARARDHSPFLRDAAALYPAVADAFLSDGALSASALALATAADLPVDKRLRRQRHALALAAALGDLAGELSLEQVTALLSDFADQAIDQAVRAAIAERVPDADAAGFAVIAMGKLGSHELNYSSDVDLLLLFDPATLRGALARKRGSRLFESDGGSSSFSRSGPRTAMSSGST